MMKTLDSSVQFRPMLRPKASLRENSSTDPFVDGSGTPQPASHKDAFAADHPENSHLGLEVALKRLAQPELPHFQPAGPKVATWEQNESMLRGIHARATQRNAIIGLGSGLLGLSGHIPCILGVSILPIAGSIGPFTPAAPRVVANPNSAVVKESAPLGRTNYFLPSGSIVVEGPDRKFSAIAPDADQAKVPLKTQVQGEWVTVFNNNGTLTTLNTIDLTLETQLGESQATGAQGHTHSSY